MSESAHILVIDDEKNYLLVLQTLLEDEGYTVTAINDPETALAHAQDVIGTLSREQGTGNSLALRDALEGLWRRVEEQADGAAPCIASGFPQYDKLLGGGFID